MNKSAFTHTGSSIILCEPRPILRTSGRSLVLSSLRLGQCMVAVNQILYWELERSEQI